MKAWTLILPLTALLVGEGLHDSRASSRGEHTLAQQVALGEHLFFDERLSFEQDRSCATCHDPRDNFGGPPRAPGEVTVPSLRDVSRQKRLGRANTAVSRLEDQTRVALFGEDPVEMGMSGGEHLLIARLCQVASTCEQVCEGRFEQGTCVERRAEERLVIKRLILALTAYQRTLTFGDDAPVDRWARQQNEWPDELASQGAMLFVGEGGCARCHSGDLYAESYRGDGPADQTGAPAYFRMRTPSPVAWPSRLGRGVQAATGRADDLQRFKVPTLRGIARRGYYFHEGARMTLREAIASHAPHLDEGAHERLARFVEGLTL